MNISEYSSAGETYRARLRVKGDFRPTDEGIEPEPEEVLEVIEDLHERVSKARDSAAIITTWQATNEALATALLDLEAPIPRAEAIALLSAVFVDPAQKVIDDLAAGHRALRDEVVFSALRAAGVPLMRTGDPDTSVWVGMISGILRQNRSMRLRKRVYPSDRFAEQQKMFASFAAFQRFGCAGDAVFDVWHDRDGQRVTLASFKEDVDRLTEALENLRRRITSLTSSAAEVVFCRAGGGAAARGAGLCPSLASDRQAAGRR